MYRDEQGRLVCTEEEQWTLIEMMNEYRQKSYTSSNQSEDDNENK